ncbi:uncharacterized protein LOC111254022 [Varroa destructor]|uniref:Uncharacterized protein n=1 Tax=Varroa destructor TaxID=109461 RepID=A0A7M7KV16_VARDE|nr:uncharacterized protein LOC111254022 [Varroa destructor]
MSTNIEEIESEDQLQSQLDIEESETANTEGLIDPPVDDIEEIHTQALPATHVQSSLDSFQRPKQKIQWLENSSCAASKKHSLGAALPYAPEAYPVVRRQSSRASVDIFKPFADLPRQFTEAVARLQSTRSMHNSLTTSNIYAAKTFRDKNSRSLRLKITEVIRSCGNTYVDARSEDGEKYIVHLPSSTLEGDPLPGKCLLLAEPYIRRKLRDSYLISLVISVEITS